MKTEVKVQPHLTIDGAFVVELWHDGRFIGEVTGADGPGVRVISKYPMQTNQDHLMVVEVTITP